MKRALLLLVFLGLGLAGPAPSSGWPSRAQAALPHADSLGRTVDSGPSLGPAAAVGPSSVGGYTEEVAEVAFAVEANGRVHMLWTGKLNPYFDDFAFYSWSADGVNWSPYQIINYYSIYDPQVVVDDTHRWVHLIYRSNEDGIIHHTVSNGVVSPPAILGFDAVTSPKLAVDPTTGRAYAVWQQGSWYWVNENTAEWRQRTWYAYWDGSGWSGAMRIINNQDTSNPAIAVAPGGRVMVAWFQDWAQSQGGPTDPGRPTIPRTAYSTDGVKFRLRQAVSSGYTTPEKDDLILLAYSPSDDKFYMLTDHLMWPGHSIVYRFAWNGTWSAPLDISQNPLDWATPLYIGAAQNVTSTYYAWFHNGIKARTETNGVLGAVQDIGRYLSDNGYSASQVRFFLDRAGKVHFALVGSKDGVPGLYYVRPTS